MSLAISVKQVQRVLLADTWHNVASDTFILDYYEFVERIDAADPDLKPPASYHELQDGPRPVGFRFKESDTGLWMHGPLSSILAVVGPAPMS